MLKSISVRNFMGIQGLLRFDTTKSDDLELSVINGCPGSGKTSLCLAMLDPINHLSMYENNRPMNGREIPYINIYSEQGLAEFRFEYEIDGCKVYYGYGKTNKNGVVWEELHINDEVMTRIDRRDSHIAEINLPGAETLRRNLETNQTISVVRYVKSNSVLDRNSKVTEIFLKFCDFNEHVYFSSPAYLTHSARSENSYILSNNAKYIHKHQLTDQLNKYFRDLGLNLFLFTQEEWGNATIKVKREGKTFSANFALTESQIMLIDVFVAIHKSEQCSLVIIDDVSKVAGVDFENKISQYIINNCKSQIVLTDISKEINKLNKIEPFTFK